MAKGLDEIMTLEEMAKYLKIGKSTLYNMVREGKIPAMKIANQWRFRKEDIDRWLKEQNFFTTKTEK
jgi:excisionase family DNA binding protein